MIDFVKLVPLAKIEIPIPLDNPGRNISINFKSDVICVYISSYTQNIAKDDSCIVAFKLNLENTTNDKAYYLEPPQIIPFSSL